MRTGNYLPELPPSYPDAIPGAWAHQGSGRRLSRNDQRPRASVLQEQQPWEDSDGVRTSKQLEEKLHAYKFIVWKASVDNSVVCRLNPVNLAPFSEVPNHSRSSFNFCNDFSTCVFYSVRLSKLWSPASSGIRPKKLSKRSLRAFVLLPTTGGCQ